ncbi:MAG: S8 family serine peptidase [Desulfosarcina sp.]
MFHKQIGIGILAFILLAIRPSAAADESVQPPFMEGEVLVKYRDTQATQRASHYRSVWRLSDVRTFDKSGIRKVKLPDGMTVSQAVELYQSDPDVLYVEPNYRYRIQAIPDDPQIGHLWGLYNYGQQVNGSSGTPGADLNTSRAWDLETGSRSIVVAVVDSGVDLDHPDLAANLWVNPDEIAGNGLDDDNNGYVDDAQGWDFADNDNLPYDSHGHGTHVAGIIGAVGNNGTGVTGVCWQVSIMPLRFITATQYGTTADAIAAIEYADDKGADIINLSWGGTHYSRALQEAIDATDAVVVCAAGNQGIDLDAIPLYPASYDSPHILSVAASDADDNPTWFTNYGSSRADLTAPGIDILSTVPDRETLFVDDFVFAGNWAFGGAGNRWGMEWASDGRQVLSVSANSAGYEDNADSWAVITEPFNLVGRTGARMDFQVSGIGADAGDRLSVEASTDQTQWRRLRIGLEDDETTDSITGSLPTWQPAAVDLGLFDDNAVVYLRFRFVSDATGNANGYSITDLTVTCSSGANGAENYQYFQGTSMSAAYTSGVAALILARKPYLTPVEVKLIIETSVDRKPQLSGYVATAGRINAYKALESVADVALQTQTLASDRINLDWSSRKVTASGFEIWRLAGDSGEFITVAVAGPDEVEYTDSGLSADTTYVYRILTLSDETRTGYSNEASATTFGNAAMDGADSGGGGCFITVLTSGSDAPEMK